VYYSVKPEINEDKEENSSPGGPNDEGSPESAESPSDL